MASTTTKRTPKYQPVRRLPAESWGRRLARARAELAGLTVYTAAEEASRFWPQGTTHATINRIEQLVEAPDRWTHPQRRAVAYVLCRIYRTPPADWGLSRDDVPPSVSEQLDQEVGPETDPYQDDHSSRCTAQARLAA